MAYEPYEYDPKLNPTRITGLNAENDQYLQIDASVELRHEGDVIVTKHPVEIGANISDFAIVQPRKFTLTGRISIVKPKQEGESDDTNDIISGAVNRVAEAWTALENAMRNRYFVSIDTILKTYDDMLITSLRTTQDWRTARVLDFTANLQEIITVAVKETELTEAQLLEGGTREQASPTSERGDVQPVEAAPSLEEQFTTNVLGL